MSANQKMNRTALAKKCGEYVKKAYKEKKPVVSAVLQDYLVKFKDEPESIRTLFSVMASAPPEKCTWMDMTSREFYLPTIKSQLDNGLSRDELLVWIREYKENAVREIDKMTAAEKKEETKDPSAEEKKDAAVATMHERLAVFFTHVDDKKALQHKLKAAELYAKRGNYTAAEIYLECGDIEKALGVVESDWYYHEEIKLIVYLKADEIEKAEEHAENYIKNTGGDRVFTIIAARMCRRISDYHTESGNKEKADSYNEKALELYAKEEWYPEIAEIHLKSKDMDKVRESAKKCEEGGEYEVAANLYSKLGEKEKQFECLVLAGELGEALKLEGIEEIG